MSKERLTAYLKHIDLHGVDMVVETALTDKRLTEEERAAVEAYANLKKSPPKGRKKGRQG